MSKLDMDLMMWIMIMPVEKKMNLRPVWWNGWRKRWIMSKPEMDMMIWIMIKKIMWRKG